jgi:hypothetical protein
MSVNYYAVLKKRCTACGADAETIHLGKLSSGWAFVFNLNGEKYYKNASEMKDWLQGRTILNEYGEKISEKYFWNLVEERQRSGKSHTGEGILNIDGFNFIDGEFF